MSVVQTREQGGAVSEGWSTAWVKGITLDGRRIEMGGETWLSKNAEEIVSFRIRHRRTV